VLRDAVQQYGALIRPFGAREHLQQGGPARAVVSDERQARSDRRQGREQPGQAVPHQDRGQYARHGHVDAGGQVDPAGQQHERLAQGEKRDHRAVQEQRQTVVHGAERRRQDTQYAEHDLTDESAARLLIDSHT